MKVIENKNPLWTEKHLEHVRKYRENYGLKNTEDDFEFELSNIREGRPSKRCNDDMRCFELYNNGEHIGDITISKQDEGYHELDLVVFDEYADKGYAKEAIKEFINIYKIVIGKRLDVIVRAENPNKNKVKYILEFNGFKFQQCHVFGDLIFYQTF